MQRLADILGEPVEVAAIPETTALGAAYHAGQAVGFYGDDAALPRLDAVQAVRAGDGRKPNARPAMRGWLEAVARVRSRQGVIAQRGF